MNKHTGGIISTFMNHRVAANLLMLLMLFTGLYAVSRINVQFLPTFDVNMVTVQIDWPGAVADDVEKSLANSSEKELRGIENLKELRSSSRQSGVLVVLEFYEGTDMSLAIENVRARVARIKNLPVNSEKPIVTRVEPYERVAKLLVYGPKHLEDLKEIAYRFEKELLALGIGKVELIGLPKSEINIAIHPKELAKYKLSLPQISQIISNKSQDISGGHVGAGKIGQNIRILAKRRSVKAFESLVLITDNDGEKITLGDVATITREFEEEGVRVYHHGQPAIELKLLREAGENSLKSAKKVHRWLAEKKAELGQSLNIVVFEEQWQLIKQRIDTLVNNGLSGLVLIIILLFIFLSRPIALWIVVGIPTALLGSVFILYASGGSINMVSLFAFILTLGIIVDDTIVIGEESLTHLAHHESVGESVLTACQKMWSPIASSSLTTIAAFFPLLFITGPMGMVLFDIPMVVICVLIASLVECFMVLPGHLFHSLSPELIDNPSAFRMKVDEKVANFGENTFKPILRYCIIHYYQTIAVAVGLLILSIALVASPLMNFNFFPTPDSKQVMASVRFISGEPEEVRREVLMEVGNAAKRTAKKLEKKYNVKNLIEIELSHLNTTEVNRFENVFGTQYGNYYVGLTSSENRPFGNAVFIEAWEEELKPSSAVENVSISSPREGPPEKDIAIDIYGTRIIDIKEAARGLKEALQTYSGVHALEDNLPFSQEQLVFKLNEKAHALQLSEEDIGRQMRAAFYGQIVQRDYTSSEEVDVRVVLDKKNKENLSTLSFLPIVTPNNTTVPLSSVGDISYQYSSEVILHTDTKLSAKVSADVDSHVANANQILNQLSSTLFEKIEKKHHVKLMIRGLAETEEETLHNLKIGLVIALWLIYMILAWVFASYRLPVIVMLAIPLGLIGAILGHFVMGLNMTLLSLFGLFGLSGIVINDSIILVREYQTQREKGLSVYRACETATVNRLRAVMLTSVTTIAGLTPLLFERSQQAQFLIPMAVSICFGLFFAMFLILLVLPALVVVFDPGSQKQR